MGGNTSPLIISCDLDWWTYRTRVIYRENDQRLYWQRLANNLLSIVNLPQSTHILDVACGDGRFSEASARLGHQVTGIDIHPKVVMAASNRVRKYNLTSVNFVCANIHNLPFLGVFDVISLLGNIGSIDNGELHTVSEVIKSCMAVLRPGGLFILQVEHLPRYSDHVRIRHFKLEDGQAKNIAWYQKDSGCYYSLYFENVSGVLRKMTQPFRVRYYHPETLLSLMEQQFLEDITIFSGREKSLVAWDVGKEFDCVWICAHKPSM